MTSQFRVSNLTKTFGSNTIVDQLDLDIEDGEFLVLLGPSGCGKTTTLRCIAGLETPEGGSITFKDHTVFDASTRVNVPAYKRNIGMVFQSYALWPNMTVRENIRYPLKVRRMKSAIAAGRSKPQQEWWTAEPCSTGIPPNSAVGSNSEWRWRADWSHNPIWCCSTNP